MKKTRTMPGTPAQPRGRPRAFAREDALERAMTLFWERGYDGSSLDDLCAAMGLSPSSLYAGFGDKRGLFRQAVEHYLAGPGGYPSRIFAAAPTARVAVHDLLKAASREITSPERPPGCMVALGLMQGAPQIAELKAMLRDHREAGRRALTARIARGIAEGELPAHTDAVALTNFYLTVLHGMSIHARDGATAEELLATAEVAMQAWPGDAR
jgi:AcrR family transcriptional regulator